MTGMSFDSYLSGATTELVSVPAMTGMSFDSPKKDVSESKKFQFPP